MKKFSNVVFLLVTLLSVLFNCKSDKKTGTNNVSISETYSDIIEIKTLSMEFQMPDTIPSGWNTIKYSNKANETHFYRFIK
jgi:exonuclease I